VPTSRRRTLYLVAPGCLLLGVAALATQVSEDGLSGAVIAGIVAGVLFAAAMVAAVATRWNRPPTREQLRESRRVWERNRSRYVGLGLLAGGLAVSLGGLIADVTAFVVALFGVMFVAAAFVLAAMAIRRPELWT
jgi:Na+/proline symporter